LAGTFFADREGKKSKIAKIKTRKNLVPHGSICYSPPGIVLDFASKFFLLCQTKAIVWHWLSPGTPPAMIVSLARDTWVERYRLSALF